MSASLQEQQQPIFMRMANALIGATPEQWSEATLELVPTNQGKVVGLAHCISNSVHPKDIVEPTPELFEATQQLQELSRKHGDNWQRCLFHVFEEGSAWRFSAEFQR